ncbi:uncharacterized protein VTP21DRAFT_3383 [Calcarisporiella thermophila]|uniref:uncharacterized protein n=1 Tax=Calcarisporiella thermophila TaxID=911321 RepID=UPI0037426193
MINSSNYNCIATFPLMMQGLRRPYFYIQDYETYGLEDKYPKAIFESRKIDLHVFCAKHFPSFNLDYIVMACGMLATIVLALFALYDSTSHMLRFFIFIPPILLFFFFYMRRSRMYDKLRLFETKLNSLLYTFTQCDVSAHSIAWLPRRLPSAMPIMFTSISRYAIDLAVVEPEDYIEELPAYSAVGTSVNPIAPPTYAFLGPQPPPPPPPPPNALPGDPQPPPYEMETQGVARPNHVYIR